ncbi:MAG: hypothetical protein Q8O67_19805 [Deltaproteobacteria bacterium]|nr:hypothetical protein [Deltaproteobacteria bacterium]
MSSPVSAPRLALLVSTLAVVAVGCPAPEPPPLQGVQVGTLVGEVFVEDPDQRSLGDAVITVLGSPAAAVSVADKQFVLESVALGTRTVSIVHEGLGRAARFETSIESPFQTVTLDAADTTLKRSASVSGSMEGVSREDLPQVFLVGGTSQQVVVVGDDGNFLLSNLPVGTQRIGFSAVGRGLRIESFELVEGETTALPAVALEANATGNLRISGTVQLTGEIDHAGVTMILNGGSQVVGTADDGTYVFSDLAPGLFTIEASRPGFRSVLMSTVALTDDGKVEGLFDAFLAPGQDVEDVVIVGEGEGEGEGEPADTLEVFIDNPRVADRLFSGDDLLLGARVEGTVADAVAPAELAWGFRAAGTVDALTALGTGRVVVVDTAAFPGLLGEIELVLTGTHGGLTDVSVTTIFVDELIVTPIFNARVDLGAGGSAIALPSITVGADGVINLPMIETQPVSLSATVIDGRGVDVSGGLEWASDTGFFFTGPESALSILPIGTHRFAVRFSDGQNLIDAATVDVVVAALDFSLVIEAPLEAAAATPPRGDVLNNPPYFDDTGVPLLAVVRHPFQIVFPVTAATWRDDAGNVVATGPLLRQANGSFFFTGRARNLAAGAHVLTLSLSDVQGNAASATTVITLQDVQFTASFVAPAVDAEVEEGDAVVVDVDVAHSLLGNGLARSDLRVSYTSSLIGLLRDAAGTTLFGVDDTPALVGMGIGRHGLTARVSDGRGIALATRDVVVRRPGVNITILEPSDNSAFSPGLAVRFTATAVEDDANDDPTYRWLIDDVELDASFGDYGVDPASTNRLTIDLGVFTANTGIFANARLAPGPHVLKFCAQLELVDSCQSVAFEVPPLGFELCPSSTARSITAGQTEVWEGVRRLNCDVTVNGGTLIIAPGARIVVDDPPAGADRNLFVGASGGSVRIGDIGSNRPAILESNTRVGASWGGFNFSTSGATPASVIVENAIIRDTNRAFDRAFSGVFESEQQFFSLRNVTFEKVAGAWESLCPDFVDGVTVDNTDFATNIAAFTESTYTRCFDTPRTYSRVNLINVTNGVQLARGGTVTFEGSSFQTFNSSIEPNIFVGDDSDARLIVRDSVFQDSGNLSDPAITMRGCMGLTVERSSFIGNVVGVAEDNDECRLFDRDDSRMLILSSHFEGNNVGVELFNGIAHAELHLNTFVGNVIDIRADGTAPVGTNIKYGVDVDARANFFDRGTPFLRGIGAGRTLNLPGVADFFDNSTGDRVVRTTPTLRDLGQGGPTTTTRTALLSPDLQVRLAPGMCVAPKVFALDGDVTFVSAATLAPGECAVFEVGPSGDPDGLDLTSASLDIEGCIDVDFAPGEHTIAVHCAHAGGVDVHDARFLVDDQRFAGVLEGAAEVRWSGEIVLDGDVTVPRGTTLVIEAGTTVRLATSDRLALQVFRNHADNPDGSDSSCTGCFADATVNGSFGDRSLVDIYVEGSLVAEGTAADPIVFLPEDGVVAPSKWGGLRLGLGSSSSLANVDIGGAVIALHGEFAPIDPFSEPLIVITDSVIRESSIGIRGPCPLEYARNTMNRVITPMGDLFCSDGLVIEDSDFVDVGNPAATDLSSMFSFSSYSNGGSDNGSVVVDRVSLSRLGGTNEQVFLTTNVQARIATVAVRDSDIENINGLLSLNSDRAGIFVAAVIERTNVTNFDLLVRANNFGSTDRIDIDQCRFTRGNQILNNGGNEFDRDVEMTRTQVSQVVVPFLNMRLEGTRTFRLVFTDNSFDTATDVVSASTNTNAVGDRAVDARRNNFTNISGRIVKLSQVDADSQISVDLTGGFFNTTDTAVIEAKFDDAQADLGADFKGRTHYAPFSATALTLDLLP